MRAEWFFDFISPFSYLQLESFHRLPATVEIEPVPILFAGLLGHWQHKGPAEIPSKRRFTYRHCQWMAQQHGIPFRFPPAHPFNPIRLLRLAIACGSRIEPIRDIFRFVWREGQTADDPAAWARLCERLGIADAEARIAEQSVKDRLRANGERAVALGLFGVPTFAVGGELFWGFDATEMFADYLRDPGMLTAPEIARVSDLPVGKARV